MITVPGKDIHGGHTEPQDHAHEDINVAIRDAFNAAGRLLEDHARTMRGAVKTDAVPQQWECGPPRRGPRLRRETTAGEEIYFHRNSVAGGRFEDLKTGSEVRLVVAEKEGEQGPEASTVTPIGEYHIVS